MTIGPGTKLGRYEICSKLGAGGMGDVYLADVQLRRKIALKVFTSDETGHYEIYVRSFSAEGKLGADKKIVSKSGGKLPIWRHDGSELFFVAADEIGRASCRERV